jgi:hypothetical protein
MITKDIGKCKAWLVLAITSDHGKIITIMVPGAKIFPASMLVDMMVSPDFKVFTLRGSGFS